MDKDNFYLKHSESINAALQAAKALILQQDPDITHAWKYGMPFFCYKGKMFCYLWVHKKYNQPYIGFVEGNRFDETFLLQESRSRMKIMLIDSDKDLPLETIVALIHKAINFYKEGLIKIK